MLDLWAPSVLKSSTLDINMTVPDSIYSFFLMVCPAETKYEAKDAVTFPPHVFLCISTAQNLKIQIPNLSPSTGNCTDSSSNTKGTWWAYMMTCLPLAKTHCLLGVLRGFQRWGMTLPGHQGSKPSRGWSWGSVWRKTSVWPSSSDQDLGPPGFILASRKITSVYPIIVSLYPNNELSCSLWFLFYFF